MALITCKDCRTQHSDEAKACPKCGKPVGKRTSTGTIVIGCVFAVFVFGLVKACGDMSDRQEAATSSEAARRAALTPEQRVAEDAKAAEMERAQSLAGAGAKQLKASMRDPDSFKLVSALKSPFAKAICYTYRSRNGFGGMNVEQAILVEDSNEIFTGDRAVGHWGKYCGQYIQDTGADLTAIANAYLEH